MLCHYRVNVREVAFSGVIMLVLGMMTYTADPDSLSRHPVPQWYHDAKFGIFVHWSLSSIPAWAPADRDLQELMKSGMGELMRNQPYAEWYLNSIRIPGSPAYEHHRKVYGDDFSYFEFQKEFEERARGMDASVWADLFAEVGAKYVVMVTKHHDGYTLWPSKHPHPHMSGYGSSRDFVGEVTDAVRSRGIKMGLYYSGVYDWTYMRTPIASFVDFLLHFGQGKEYTEYATAHFYELIERYQPSVLWNDIGYPMGFDVNELFAHYYNTIAEGVVNDRWSQHKIPRGPIGKMILKRVLAKAQKKIEAEGFELTPNRHYDFRTPEYMSYSEIRDEKWESCRGIGHSFGFNQNETREHMIGGLDLIWMLIDIVSKNGNLLLNVGPTADGEIPQIQQKPLKELGTWLKSNGEAIYGTRPWRSAEGELEDGTHVRFAGKVKYLFIFVKSLQGRDEVVLKRVGGASEQETHHVVWSKAQVVGNPQAKLSVDVSAHGVRIRGVADARSDKPVVVRVPLGD